jgi:hypothetical protein
MSGFYVSLIFFGILLILFSLVCIFLDKKKVFSFSKNFEDRKQELVEIINDAEQMIEELNKFSDYIVNQMDIKNEQLNRNLKAADEKVNDLSKRAKAAVNEATSISELVETRQFEAKVSKNHAIMMEPVAEAAGIAVNSGISGGVIISGVNETASARKIPGLVADKVNCPPMHSAKKSEKVIPINNKYSEVIRLSQEGLYEVEIAKKLNMGKGEVELILGLRK